jgi:hypothetical protein
MIRSPIPATVIPGDPMLEIQFRDAKATLSKVIDNARQGRPLFPGTDSGKPLYWVSMSGNGCRRGYHHSAAY